MTPAARLSAAIEVLGDIETRRRPATDALKDWGLSHRFAGSKDRAAIASLVYDSLRRKASAAWVMGENTPRAVVLGMLVLQRGLSFADIARLFSGERFAPEPVTGEERARIEAADLKNAPAPVAGDFPDWIEPSLRAFFGDDLVPELQALTARAPLDLRVNALKVDSRSEAHDALPHLGAVQTPLSPWGLRIQPGEDGRGPAVQSEPEFIKGWIEIQDEGSQLAAILSGVQPDEQVVDLCAGGGGKTLALAAMMNNHGQLYATDSDARRLAPIHERVTRAGIRNLQIRTPRARADAVGDLDGKMDCVVVDAPCTGIGTWRRNPDAKWRLRPGSLDVRRNEQAAVLDRAGALVKPGGRIIYITCSILPEENDDAVAAFLERTDGFAAVPVAEVLERAEMEKLAPLVRNTRHGLQMTPLKTGTDGFYVAVLRKS
ncbi:RsmB/NOP family class I SAM-dependent RNA methyltransferase [Microvirga brassicacearum]|uniref:RsmB/NOP family class I SAM-dependent RNA methyltransferase n=1 Tax=Microvirga brassicacearum TaxID=2580413 RepID=A0A5N3PET6_9HYPH|nr:RsmB/NOP family class I SAM-dependent RNA methyltransferase [Microvirga brassicacearum]KAB0268214.1 RsmB/NOP family class I SAM-dependent RNA methyltransferase [Microvirga brassicacearum]